MKKRTNSFKKFSAQLILIIIFGLVYLLPFYRSEFYVSHDGENIIAKSAATHKAISDFQVPPRWAGDMNYEYGTPVLSFAYPLSNYLISAFYSIGINFETAYKILIGSLFIISGTAFYLYLNLLFKKEVSFAGAMLYMLAPYHFLDLYVRGHVGEMMAIAISPIVIYFLEKNLAKPNFSYIIFGALFYGILILSHNILGLLLTGVFVAYLLLFSKSFYNFFKSIPIFLIGLSLSSFFWIPALFEGKYINSKLFVGNYFLDHFIKIENLIYAPWGFGANINEMGGLAPQIGVIPAVLVIAALFGLKFKKKRKPILFWSTILFVSLFFTNEISSPIWSKIHTLEQFQFPWRFIAIASFAAAVLGAYALSLIKKNFLIYLIVGLMLISSIGFMQVVGFIKKPDSFYLNYPGTGAYHGESTTIWTEGDASEHPAFPLEIIAGRGEISDYARKSNIHKFKVVANSDLVIRDNTVYYPGWRALVDGQEVPIQFQDPNHRGIITFPVGKGKHDIEVKFSETTIRLFTDIVSAFTLVILLALFLYRKKIDKLINKQ